MLYCHDPPVSDGGNGLPIDGDRRRLPDINISWLSVVSAYMPDL